MAKYDIMDFTGHSTMEFDLSTDAGVIEAMEKFAELVKDGKSIAATRKAGEKSYTIARKFDVTADETLFIPRMAGG